MKTVALFLCLLSVRLFAANPSFNDFNPTMFGTTGNKVYIPIGATVSNLVVRSNLTVQASPQGTNENLGNNSVLVGNATVQGSSNQISSTAGIGFLVAKSAVSNSVNRITGAGVNMLLGTTITSAGTNEAAAATGPTLSLDINRGGLNRADGLGSFMIARTIGAGTNQHSGLGVLAGVTGDGGFNFHNGNGFLMGDSTTSGSNVLSANPGLLIGIAQNGGYNNLQGAGSAMIATGNKGTNTVTGLGAMLVGSSSGSNSLTATGSPSFLFGIADSTFGSSAATAANAFFIGAGNTNSTANSLMVAYGNSNQVTVTSLGLGIGTNATTAGVPFELHGSGHVSQDFHVEGFLEASHGSLTMCTGIVTVATSQSTNLIHNVWSYTHLDAPLGLETNTLFVVTNAAHFFISFGAAVSANASGSGTISLHVSTNGVLCDSILFFEAPSQGAATYETGFKEFAIDLPAMCRVGLWVGETTAQSVNLKNVCFNMKGGN